MFKQFVEEKDILPLISLVDSSKKHPLDECWWDLRVVFGVTLGSTLATAAGTDCQKELADSTHGTCVRFMCPSSTLHVQASSTLVYCVIPCELFGKWLLLHFSFKFFYQCLPHAYLLKQSVWLVDTRLVDIADDIVVIVSTVIQFGVSCDDDVEEESVNQRTLIVESGCCCWYTLLKMSQISQSNTAN